MYRPVLIQVQKTFKDYLWSNLPMVESFPNLISNLEQRILLTENEIVFPVKLYVNSM